MVEKLAAFQVAQHMKIGEHQTALGVQDGSAARTEQFAVGVGHQHQHHRLQRTLQRESFHSLCSPCQSEHSQQNPQEGQLAQRTASGQEVQHSTVAHQLPPLF